MRQKFYLALGIIIILGAILIAGCRIPVKPPVELPNIQTIYSIGSGWTGWQETLTINNDGSIILEEQQPFEGNQTTKSTQLSNAEIQKFKEMVNEANVFNYENSYTCGSSCPTDLPSSSVKFIIDGREKTVSMYAPSGMPESLTQILEKIRKFEQRLK